MRIRDEDNKENNLSIFAKHNNLIINLLRHSINTFVE